MTAPVNGENRPRTEREPWPGFDPSQACWSHHQNEPRTRRTFITCFECGHVYTRWSLWRAWTRTGKELARWDREHPPPFAHTPPSRLRQWAHRWFKRPSRIFHCQECVHDF